MQKVAGKYRDYAHKDCNTKVELNHKIPVAFHNLKNYDSHLIMQELGKTIVKTNFIPYGLETWALTSI